jgi:hypothetical protein
MKGPNVPWAANGGSQEYDSSQDQVVRSKTEAQKPGTKMIADSEPCRKQAELSFTPWRGSGEPEELKKKTAGL